jgi:methyl-accepting chemotaxis protein
MEKIAMPASMASTNVEKRAAPVTTPWAAQPLPSPSTGAPNKVHTQSTADTQAQSKQPDKYGEARKFLCSHHLLVENSPCNAITLAGVLLLLAETYKMPENVAKTLAHITKVLKHIEQQTAISDNTASISELLNNLQHNISSELDSKLIALKKKLTLPPPAQEQLETAAKEIGQAAESIKTSINDMGNSLARVTDTTSQLANTATSYKEALINGSNQSPCSSTNTPQADPKIIRDVDRKACQILVDTLDPKIMEVSYAEIKDKVSNSINAITNPPPPQDITQGHHHLGDQ